MTIFDWEKQFWVSRMAELDPLVAFLADIDTTFAVYSIQSIRERKTCISAANCGWFFFEGIRVGGSFTAEHTPWLAGVVEKWNFSELNASYGLGSGNSLSGSAGSTTGKMIRPVRLSAVTM